MIENKTLIPIHTNFASILKSLMIYALLFLFSSVYAQSTPYSTAEIAHQLKRLAHVGSVLYLAAHPDDENTRFIAWTAQGKGLDTGYLSLTRGGGGQNLIGAELSHLLGYIRTQELLAARALDGGQQFFTRAIDFGYSKSAEETERIWGRDHIIRDMVRVIRLFRPDLIVCRFSPTRKSHGHHVASARLTLEAVKLAQDEHYDKSFGQGPWSVVRVVENKPHWRMKAGTDTSGLIKLDVGGYDVWRGISYGEIAGASRSMHKSQGFGSSRRKTKITEYFEVLAGKPAKDDLFADLSLDWSRFPNTSMIQEYITQLNQSFDPQHPEKLSSKLIQLDQALANLPPHTEPYRTRKRDQIRKLIMAISGLWLDAKADQNRVTPGGKLKVTLSALSRRPIAIKLKSIRVDHSSFKIDQSTLTPGEISSHDTQIALPASSTPTMPYWLAQDKKGALYHNDPKYIGTPLESPPLQAHFDLEIHGYTFTYDIPIVYRWVDPVAGERSQRVQIEPAVSITPKLDAQLLKLPGSTRVEWVAEAGPQKVSVDVMAPVAVYDQTGQQEYWAQPAQHTLTLEAGQEKTIAFEISSKGKVNPRDLTPKLRINGKNIPSLAHHTIDYPHIPKRRVFVPSRMRIAPVELKITRHRVGYVPGAGDRVPDALRQMGYTVTELPDTALDQANLSEFDVIVFGIRAFNTHPRVFPNHKRLMDWVNQGGRVVVQYNTNNRWRKLKHPVGPFPFTIGYARVTDESAPIVANVPLDHPALTTPNMLTQADYQGWVQERGLYFAVDWDARYTPLFRMADPGEEALLGSTLVSKHGKGSFVYTGLSFFRQLPAGVPGAYRLFANLLAL